MLKPLCVWKGFTAIQAAQATLKLRSNQHLEQKFTPLHRATSTRAQQQQLSGWLRSQITEQLLTFCIHLPPPPHLPSLCSVWSRVTDRAYTVLPPSHPAISSSMVKKYYQESSHDRCVCFLTSQSLVEKMCGAFRFLNWKKDTNKQFVRSGNQSDDQWACNSFPRWSGDTERKGIGNTGNTHERASDRR